MILELDEMGEARNGDVQAILKKLTGRGTVPNVFVDGVSIGGGDEMCTFQKSGQLTKVFKDAGCKFN